MAGSDGSVNEECGHVAELREVTPSGEGCAECLAMGDVWFYLRLCTTCGHVGCCDASKNKHATKHFHETGHPIIKSYEPGEDWGWCYVHSTTFERLEVAEGKYHS